MLVSTGEVEVEIETQAQGSTDGDIPFQLIETAVNSRLCIVYLRGCSVDGDIDDEYIEDGNWKCVFDSYEYEADTSLVIAAYDGEPPYDAVTIFSAEPGDLDHYALDIYGPLRAQGGDTSDVSDGDLHETNGIRIEAQDANNIRLYTYTNPDTLTLSLNGSTAGASQVTWFVSNYGEEGRDTTVGLTAPVLPASFGEGITYVYISNQVAETVTMTATDTAGHTGTSPEVTWLPIEVVGFNVGLEGGATQMETMEETNVEVTAIDEFGNATDVGLPLNVLLSANRSGVQFPGATHLMNSAVELFPTIASEVTTGLVITVSDLLDPGVNGHSYEIEVIAGGIADVPVVSGITAEFATGNIVCALATEGPVEVKVYDKVGREVATLLSGSKKPGYYPVSLEGLNLASDVYFVVMEGPDVSEKAKVTLIK